MRKSIGAFLAFALLLSAIITPQAQAASAIKIIIDGTELTTDQPPIIVDSRVLVPLRGIFEALQAEVGWDPKQKIVTAAKAGTTVILKIGSPFATINGKTVSLDVPAQIRNDRTLVPVRFVSEALGEDVKWHSDTQSVVITTSASKLVGAAAYVTAFAGKQYGDGRDLKVGFAPPADTSLIQHYRILFVKAENASSFTLAKAQAAASDRYTTVPASYTGQSTTALSAQTKDVDGAVLRTYQAYKIFILTVGKNNNALSASSNTVTLEDNTLINTASNVKISDVNDFGDGRDLSVSFSKANIDSNISNYRIMIVRSAEASKFNLEAANKVSNHYTSVSKSSSGTLTATLGSSSRDTSGQLIQNGISYTAFVLSVANNSAYKNNLSASSVSVTLSTSVVAPVITNVEDIANNGNGTDLQVSFNKASNEAFVSKYRIFVVRNADYGSFTLSEANKVASGRYTDVAKTGYNLTQTLASSAKDVKGNAIANGIAYRVFVMGISSNSSAAPNALSVASTSITLTHSGVSPVTNVALRDVSDYNDGRDLQVSFNKAPDEKNINFYRIFVVRATAASQFNLATANAISSSNNGNYTTVYKTGANISTKLPADARDTSGALVQNGVSYHVFVLSVGTGNYTGIHALSAQSAAMTLSGTALPPVTNVTVSDVSDFGNGKDLRVSFNKPSNEANINQYRVFVVRSDSASSFTLASANAITNPNLYTTVNKTGANISTALADSALDVLGVPIHNGIGYRVFVMSVGNGSSTLSNYSSAITLTNSGIVQAPTSVTVKDVADNNNGQDLQVSFTKASNESNISQYRIFIVKNANAGSFNVTTANSITNSSNYTVVSKTGGNISITLPAAAKDINGDLIKNGIGYNAFVMSVATGNNSKLNSLSASSAAITLSSSSVAAITNVAVADVGDQGNGQDLQVSFTKASNESNIGSYRIYVVKSALASTFNLTMANAVSSSNYTTVNKTNNNISTILAAGAKDTEGLNIQNGISYNVFVMSVESGSNSSLNALSAPSAAITLSITAVQPVTNIIASDVGDLGNGQDLQVSFTRPANESNINHYRILVVNAANAGNFNLNAAMGTNYYTMAAVGGNNSLTLPANVLDTNGVAIQNGVNYQVFVMSTGNNLSASTLSGASNALTLSVALTAAQAISGAQAGSDAVMNVTFSNSNEAGIAKYAILVTVNAALTEAEANSLYLSNKTTVVDRSTKSASVAADVTGTALIPGNYYVYVLSIADGVSAIANKLSAPSGPVTIV